jgi:hypothetical protein
MSMAPVLQSGREEALMKDIRKRGRPVFFLMIVLALVVSLPHPTAMAALISTDAAAGSPQGSDAREHVRQFLAREDVRAALVSQGIDPVEADARVDSLTDAEIAQIADRIDALPAGGVLGLVIVVLVIVLLVIVILKLV